MIYDLFSEEQIGRSVAFLKQENLIGIDIDKNNMYVTEKGKNKIKKFIKKDKDLFILMFLSFSQSERINKHERRSNFRKKR